MQTMRLIVTAAVAVAAFCTFMTGVAAAQEESVTVVNEPTRVPCSGAGGGSNCRIHIEGTSVLQQHIFGSESQASACTDEFDAEMQSNGSGLITEYTNVNVPACTRIMCNGIGEAVSEARWPITNPGEYATVTNNGHITVRFCLDTRPDPNSAGTHCTVEIQIDEHANHRYGFAVNDWRCPIFFGVSAELTGSWESEGVTDPNENNIEIIHQ
jgi:hypothetical protein